MKTSTITFEITKEEAILRLQDEIILNERFYDTDIQLSNGYFQTATLDNIDLGIKFFIVK